MKKYKLDKEEQDILNDFESDKMKSVINNPKELEVYQKAATATLERLNKEKRINIRLTTMDYENIKARAIDEGLPYQTMIASIIHKFVSGRLREYKTQ